MQNLPLTNAKYPTIISSLIQQINCNPITPEVINSTFPSDFVDIAVNCQSTSCNPLQNGTYEAGFNLEYYCSPNPANNYWSLTQNFNSPSNELQTLLPSNSGFGYFTFSMNVLPKALNSYASSILIFYATIVYVVASSLRSGLVPFSYQIFITDAP